ncbi:type VI secretion system protein TssA [Hafnia paralvei]|nr:type VI secretion system protein TssA [Hafnia paralvei]RDA61909.1 type VI secretion system protein TssA [Hafnia paralvei]RDA62970.1 type VI secretion system protein TssA [Hafnia paralvei]RDA63810.1 type VI secretion system protein TssA [Hafnia paralvei]RDA75096.1 type VI secretion system protein TssA [Hafnia paralvei]RDA75500.1 type VI secretion system protein TssA [Hafnia paralvei]
MQQNMEYLLYPISRENPAGENLEYDLVYNTINNARESDPDYLPKDEWSYSEPRKADWSLVKELSEKTLTDQSKDLQLCCWLVESKSHLEGLSGMSDGIEFLNEFITRYWFQCWPSLDEDGLDVRHSKLARLDRDLSQILFDYHLFNKETITLSIWVGVQEFEHKLNANPSSRDKLLQEEGDLTLETFEQHTLNIKYSDICNESEKLKELLRRIEELETRYVSLSQNTDSAIFSLTKKTINDVLNFISRLIQRTKPITIEVETYQPTDCALPDDKFKYDSVTKNQEVIIREKAIKQLLEIAVWFRKTEPSSPVPFLIERAARWANMPLTQWLEEVIEDNDSIKLINNVLIGKHQ